MFHFGSKCFSFSKHQNENGIRERGKKRERAGSFKSATQKIKYVPEKEFTLE